MQASFPGKVMECWLQCSMLCCILMVMVMPGYAHILRGMTCLMPSSLPWQAYFRTKVRQHDEAAGGGRYGTLRIAVGIQLIGTMTVAILCYQPLLNVTRAEQNKMWPSKCRTCLLMLCTCTWS
jgi:hypothetical protein